MGSGARERGDGVEDGSRWCRIRPTVSYQRACAEVDGIRGLDRRWRCALRSVCLRYGMLARQVQAGSPIADVEERTRRKAWRGVAWVDGDVRCTKPAFPLGQSLILQGFAHHCLDMRCFRW